MGRRPKDMAIERLLRDQDRRGLRAGTRRQVSELFARLVFAPVDEVMRYADDKRAPVIAALTARALLSKGGFKNMAYCVEYAFGKAEESVDHTTCGLPIGAMDGLGAEQLDAIIARLAQAEEKDGEEDGNGG